MADTIALHLDIQNSLQKTLKQTETTMKSFNSLLEKSSKNFTSMDKTADKMVDHYDDIEKSQTTITKSTTNWLGGLKKVGSTIARIIPGAATLFSAATIFDAAKATLDLDTNMKHLSYRMGDAGKNLGALKGAVMDTVHATGIAVDQASQLVTQLRELRVPTKDLSQMTKNVARFSDITGVTATNAAELAGNLMRVGRLGSDATANVLAGMVNVQRVVGMTESEMQDLSEGIIYSTKMLNQMGKTAGQIEHFNKGVVKLAGAFTQVGLSAQDANKFVEELLDPERVQDNAFLYAKLGVSLEDAFSGNVDPGLLASKFKDLGNELRNMSGPAAAAMAKELGMPLHQLRQMSEMDLSKLEKTFQGGASGADQLAKAQNEQLSAQEKFEKSMNRVQGTIVDLMNNLMPAVNTLADFVSNISKWLSPIKVLLVGAIIAAIALLPKLKRRFLTVATDTKKAIQTGIVEAFDQGSKKGVMAMRENVSGKNIDRAMRVRQGSQFGQMNEAAGGFDVLAESNVFKRVQKMDTNTADWLRTISAGAKPVSKISQLTAQYNKRIMDRLNFMSREETIRQEHIKSQRDLLDDEIKSLQTRSSYLQVINRTAEQDWELEKIQKEINKRERSQLKLRTEAGKQEERFTNLRQKYVKRLSEEQLRGMLREQQATVDLHKSQMSAAQTRQNELQDSLKLLDRELELNKNDYFMREKIRVEQEKLNAELRDQESILQASGSEINKIESQMSQIREIAGKQVDITAGAEPKFKTMFRRTGDYLRARLNDAGSALNKQMDKVRESMRHVAKNVSERLNPKNWAASIRRRFLTEEGRAEARQKRASKQGGGILGLIGPVMIIARLLGNLEPVQKAMNKLMEQIRPALNKIIGAVMPIINQLIDTLGPFVAGIIDIFAPIIQKIFEALKPLFKSLLDILIQLVNLLLPPLIKVLGFLLNVAGKIVEVVGNLIKFMMELPERISFALPKVLGGQGGEGTFQASEKLRNNAIYQVADGISQTGRALSDAGKEMQKMTIKPINIDQKAIEKATAAGVSSGMSESIERSWEPAQLRASERGIRVESHMREVTRVTQQKTADAATETATNTQSMASDSSATREAMEMQAKETETMKNQQAAMLEQQRRTNTLLERMVNSLSR